MQQLIKKELILQKKTLGFGLLYSLLLFAVFANAIFEGFAYSMSAFGMLYITIVGIAQAEYKNNSDIIINSLPTTRREIVGAKYLSIITCTIIALVIVSFVGLVFHQLPAPFHYRLINMVDVVMILVSVLLLAAISLPIYFKTGAQWVRIVNMFIFMIIFFAPAQIAVYLSKNGYQPWIQSLTHIARDQSWLFSLSVLAIMLGLLLVSYFISLKIYLKKDF